MPVPTNTATTKKVGTRKSAAKKSPAPKVAPKKATAPRAAPKKAAAPKASTKVAPKKAAATPKRKTVPKTQPVPAKKAAPLKNTSRKRTSRAPKPVGLECHYSGQVFRSRLEARWALFLDLLGINWDYEPCFYKLSSSLYYLPDFYLPEHRMWLEVKGVPFMDAESMAKVSSGVGGPRRLPNRAAPYAPVDRILLGGSFRPLAAGKHPVHAIATASNNTDEALFTYARFAFTGSTWDLRPGPKPFHKAPATGVKAARRPTKPVVEALLEPAHQPGECAAHLRFAYRQAQIADFEPTHRKLILTPEIAELSGMRRSGRPLPPGL